MPVPEADQISLEECIFQRAFHLGKELVVICTLSRVIISHIRQGGGWHSAHSRPQALQTCV